NACIIDLAATENMTLSELLYSHYPHAPKRLLYRNLATGDLASRSCTLAGLEVTGDNVVAIRASKPQDIPLAQWQEPPIYSTSSLPPHLSSQYLNYFPDRGSSSAVKGELLFSFRYRHLSDEDVEILQALQLRFKLPTRPVESYLARANICSTCQQRLRRARLARAELEMLPFMPNSARNANDAEYDPSDMALATLLASSSTRPGPVASWADRYNALRSNTGLVQPHLSAMRSTLQLHPVM
ncbi:hypothetical protein IWW57_003559, partial [Coemansia sp. S610]